MQFQKGRKNEKKIVELAGNRYLIVFSKVLLGIIFIIASIGKILAPEVFMHKIYEYTILPDFLVPAFSYFMPWIEFITGFLLLFDVYIRADSITAVMSLAAFIFAIFVQISRGVNGLRVF